LTCELGVGHVYNRLEEEEKLKQTINKNKPPKQK
jgi:hypothetical protein